MGNKVIKAAVFGGLLGATVGFLLAPKPGKELRQDLTTQAHSIVDKTQGAWQCVDDKTQVTVNTGKSLVKRGKRLLSNLKTLVHEIRHGALTKTAFITVAEDKVVAETPYDLDELN